MFVFASGGILFLQILARSCGACAKVNIRGIGTPLQRRHRVVRAGATRCGSGAVRGVVWWWPETPRFALSKGAAARGAVAGGYLGWIRDRIINYGRGAIRWENGSKGVRPPPPGVKLFAPPPFSMPLLELEALPPSLLSSG